MDWLTSKWSRRARRYCDRVTAARGSFGALGMRAFTSGARHRGFVEVSVSHLAHDLACFDDCHHYYGPGVQGGYQFVARRGLTVMASLGVGYGPSIPDGEDNVGELIGVGFGIRGDGETSASSVRRRRRRPDRAT
jgi:hypothetical protein